MEDEDGCVRREASLLQVQATHWAGWLAWVY